ncbi:uncharacterized protein LOC131664095 [Phymastichus coffea]|uniref:uncharacterized protein LOC131664095 n=1 Tax=Phymastichus coffea TaxID=108790 RepID=UPI00273C5149|nr:uncharacterized protein LOC131664095 [Phymastichus coffea]
MNEDRKNLSEPMEFEDSKNRKRSRGGSDYTDDPTMKNKIPATRSYTANQDDITTKSDKASEFFKPDNQGPFGVWIKRKIESKEGLSAFKVGSVIFKKYKNIIDIKNRGRFKVEILFSKREEANKILTDKSLEAHNMETFIPGYRKFRKGVIRNVPLDLQEEDIKEAIVSPVGITEVKRQSRRNRNASGSDDKWIKTQTIVVTFSGQILPKDIVLYYVKASVEPYVQKLRQCYNCLKFGHVANTCKGKKRCIMCGLEEHETDTDNGRCPKDIPSCSNCSGPHKSIDSTCPVYQKYLRINVLMTHDNISFSEASKIITPLIQIPPRSKEHYPNIRSRHQDTLNNIVKEQSPVNSKNITEVVLDHTLHIEDTQSHICSLDFQDSCNNTTSQITNSKHFGGRNSPNTSNSFNSFYNVISESTESNKKELTPCTSLSPKTPSSSSPQPQKLQQNSSKMKSSNSSLQSTINKLTSRSSISNQSNSTRKSYTNRKK